MRTTAAGTRPAAKPGSAHILLTLDKKKVIEDVRQFLNRDMQRGPRGVE
jgi:hypothetical protein